MRRTKSAAGLVGYPSPTFLAVVDTEGRADLAMLVVLRELGRVSASIEVLDDMVLVPWSFQFLSSYGGVPCVRVNSTQPARAHADVF
jgi:hypothetical protein